MKQLAVSAGLIHAKAQAAAGQAKSTTALATWKAEQLLQEPDRLQRLIAKDDKYRAWSGEAIPPDVIAAAALGDDHSLAVYSETAPAITEPFERLDHDAIDAFLPDKFRFSNREPIRRKTRDEGLR